MGEDHGRTMFGSMFSSAAKSSGTDTTAASLTVTFHNLIQQPELYRQLQEEVMTVMPELDSRPTAEELDSLPLLNACIKEGLRLTCPTRTRMPRTIPEGGWTFNGHHFPPGVRCLPSYWVSPKSYGFN